MQSNKPVYQLLDAVSLLMPPPPNQHQHHHHHLFLGQARARRPVRICIYRADYNLKVHLTDVTVYTRKEVKSFDTFYH